MSYRAPNLIGNTGIYVTNTSGSNISVVSVTGIKTSQLPQLATLGTGDLISYVYNSGGTYFSRTITFHNFAVAISGYIG